MKESLESWLDKGPFTLALCSHFFGFYSHTAILNHLYQAPYRPTKITGTSAGALVGGALASGLSPLDFQDLLLSKTTKDYWDPQIGLGLLAGKKFLSILKSHFVADFQKTKTPLAVGVAQLPLLKMKFLSQGSLPEAVLASCAVPLLFPPVRLQKRWYYDGGLLQKTGIAPVDQGQRVLNVYLDTYDHFLKLRRYKQQNPNHRTIYLPRTPRVNPRNLNTGMLALQNTGIRSRHLLKKDFQENLIVLD